MFIKIQLHGQDFPPVYGESKFYEKKIKKALATIKEQTAIIEECFNEISKNENK